ncbi:MAG: glycosyltransferase [Spirochaetes bacterium]|nr:glycosyltransferase [Spirochaetota bacterium]
MKNKEFLRSKRKHIALITNHGYAGPKLPLGGAPDTGGQNFYVNSLAESMEELGYKVTIYARGGFHFFNSQRMRKGEEFLSDHIRYVYIPGGGKEFIPKEKIGSVLDEQTDYLYDHLNKESALLKCKPYDMFLFINSHYWDGAMLAVKLIERWQNDLLFDILEKNKFHPKIFSYYYRNRHRLSIAHAPEAFAGRMLLQLYPDDIIDYNDLKIDSIYNLKSFIKQSQKIPPHLKNTFLVNKIGLWYLRSSNYKKILQSINRHIWTPHSVGEIKMKNYWEKDHESKRELKFLERIDHEYYIGHKTPFVAATSEEIVKSLADFYGYPLEKIMFFPPCIDEKKFKKRTKEECEFIYPYLARVTRMRQVKLLTKRIVFETSRMDETKRKDILIKAFRKVIKKVPEAILIIGGGPKNHVFQKLERLIRRWNLTRSVFLTGFIPQKEMEELFSIADIFATASEMEGFGMTALQAAACSTPIISSNLVPFCVYYLKEDCLIVKEGDAAGFAREIIRLLTDPFLSKQLAENSYRSVNQFNWKEKTKDMILFMQKHLSSG